MRPLPQRLPAAPPDSPNVTKRLKSPAHQFRAMRACVILAFMKDQRQPDWIHQARARGLTGALHIALDALEPLGLFGAQLLWMMQPVMGLFGARAAVQNIAEALEAPGGIERLRQQLDDTEAEGH